MVDTARLLPALQTLLADNTVGGAGAQDVRDFLVSVYSDDFFVRNYTGADDTIQIQAAIDAASTAGGGTVVLEPKQYNIDQLVMKSEVMLIGRGWASILSQDAFDNGTGEGDGAMIILEDANTEKTRLSSFQMLGQQPSQTRDNPGIYYDNFGGTHDESLAAHTLDNLWIRGTKGVGVFFKSASRSSTIFRVIVVNSQSEGFDIQTADSALIDCVSGNSVRNGFIIRAGPVRLVGCKAYGAQTTFSGFDIRSDRTMLVGCEAQENNQHGFVLFNVDGCNLSGCLADSNNVNGFALDGVRNCVITGVSTSTVGLSDVHNVSVNLNNTIEDNVIHVGSFDDDAEFTGDVGNNDILINGKRIPVATGDLLAAGAANDGLMVLEDGGAGDGNIVFYVDGERFRIDGGADV